MMNDVADSKNELNVLRRKNEIIQLLSLELNRPSNLKDKLNRILEVLDTSFNLKHTMLLMPDYEKKVLKLFACRGFEELCIGAEINFGEGVIGVVAERKRKLRLNNISRQKLYYGVNPETEQARKEKSLPSVPNLESQVAFPLLANDELVAVLSAESPDVYFFNKEDENFLMTLSQLMALSIQNAMIIQQLEEKVAERTAALEFQKKELEKANASKDRLFAIIGHDLRSPAASLQNVAELVQYYYENGMSDQMSALGSRVVKSAKSINHLLDNLLNWSITQTGELTFLPEPISLCDAFNEVLEIYEDIILSKNIRVDIGGNEVSYVLCDKNGLLTILRNLVSNALKFTKPTGAISIKTRRLENRVEIRIVDNGVGISSEKMNSLFEMKEKKSTLGTFKEKGTGLGLVLVKELLKMNNGQITIESESGKGTCVVLELPSPELN
jgi:signal transduction histidine kinase